MVYGAEELRPILAAMRVGDTRSFPLVDGLTFERVRSRLNALASREWGTGAYSVERQHGAALLIRRDPAIPERSIADLQIVAPSPQPIAPGGMSREQAAAWLSPYFPHGMTAAKLRGLAHRRCGPRFYKAGRVPVYFEADLATWLPQRFKLIEALHGP